MTRFGCLAVPEAFPRPRTIKQAVLSLARHYDSLPRLKGKISVGISEQGALMLYVFTSAKFVIYDTWEGFPVNVRVLDESQFPFPS